MGNYQGRIQDFGQGGTRILATKPLRKGKKLYRKEYNLKIGILGVGGCPVAPPPVSASGRNFLDIQ